MISPLEHFYLKQEEPTKSCLLFLRELILNQDKHLSNEWKYGMPMFCYKGKMCCYLWIHKVHKQPYIGFVEGKHLNHPDLLQEKRARMKILLVDASKDIPVRKIKTLLKEMLGLYQGK
jgi:hypothetical protein